MMPIQASIGIHALDELENWVIHRRKIASIYNEQLKCIEGIRLTLPPDNIYHSYYKYYFFIEPKKFKKTRDEFIHLINNKGIFCQIGSCGEMYKENALKDFSPKEPSVNAHKLFETSLVLLCDPCISELIALENIKQIKALILDNII